MIIYSEFRLKTFLCYCTEIVRVNFYDMISRLSCASLKLDVEILRNLFKTIINIINL